MEINFEQNLIDHNVFWDIHNDETNPTVQPAGRTWVSNRSNTISADCNEKLIVAHNFFGKSVEHGVSFNPYQSERLAGGRTGLSYFNKVVNNIFFNTPNRISLAMKNENFVDGNLYDARNDQGSFLLVNPQPYNKQNLAGWQEYFGFDRHSTQAKITTDFDLETCVMEISIEGKIPESQSLNTIMNGKINSGFPGPFMPDQAQKSQETVKIKQKFPIEL